MGSAAGWDGCAGTGRGTAESKISASCCNELRVALDRLGVRKVVLEAVRMFRISWRLAWMSASGVGTGIGAVWGRNCTVSDILVRRVSQEYTVKQRYNSRAGPTYQPSVACGDHVPRVCGFSWMSTLQPGRAIGLRLKS